MDFTFGDGLLTSVVGMLVVFLVLIILMICITITSKIIGSGKKKEKVPSAASAAPAPATPLAPVTSALAAGSTGEIKTFDVPDRTAAMVMAIVADQTGEPLNTLRFKSIKEVDAKK